MRARAVLGIALAVGCGLMLCSCAPRGARPTLEGKKEARREAGGAPQREAAPSGRAQNVVPIEKLTYYCPDHPDYTSDMPGTCPKDGKFLVAKAPEGTKVRYYCPVHPEVVQDRPGKCPKDGRFLEARTSPPGTAASGGGSAPGGTAASAGTDEEKSMGARRRARLAGDMEALEEVRKEREGRGGR